MRARRKSEMLGRAALALAPLVALAGVAVAEPEAVRIDYTAPVGCPDAASFWRSLRDRTTHFRQATPDEKARSFVVRVNALPSSFSGRLEIGSPDESTAVRSVDSPICSEVASALALMTALAIDPDALTSSSKGARKTTAEPAAKPATEPRQERSAPSTVAVVARAPTDAPTRAPSWRWSVGLQGHTTFAVAPNRGYGGDLFVDAEAPDSSALGPAIRIGVFFNQSDVELATGPAVSFRWVVPGVEGCPVRLKVAALHLAVHPCLAFRIGVLFGEGRSMTHPKQAASLWSDVGPLLRLRLAVTARLSLEAQGALLLPLYRPSFTILDNGSDTTAFSVPAAGGAAGIGVSYGLP
jgi:hypothetical protein